MRHLETLNEAYPQTTNNPSQVMNLLTNISNTRLYCNYKEGNPKRTAVAYVTYKTSNETTDVPYRVFFRFIEKYKDELNHEQQGDYIHIYTKKDAKQKEQEKETKNESLKMNEYLTEGFDSASVSAELGSDTSSMTTYILQTMSKPIFKQYYYKIKGRKDEGKRTNVKAITNEEKYICYCIIAAMLSYDELKEQLLNHPNCTQNEDVKKMMNIVDTTIRKKCEGTKISNLFESINITEDYSDYIGKPLKSFLDSLDGNTTLTLEFSELAKGRNGYEGKVDDIPWFVADRNISAIQLGDNKFYNFKVITESKSLKEASKKDEISGKLASFFNKRFTELLRDNPIQAQEVAAEVSGYNSEYCPATPTPAYNKLLRKLNGIIGDLAECYADLYMCDAPSTINEALPKNKDDSHRYKVVAADENAEELYMRDVKGIKSAEKELALLSNDQLADLGATQVYIERDDGKEVYLKFANDDGSWDIVQNDIEMEYPDEERHTLWNCLLADLGNESPYFVGDLRRIDRKTKKTPGKVGFNYDEVGIVGDVVTCVTPHDYQIDWAKEVADAYGFKTSPVIQRHDGRKAIKIYATGIDDETLDPRIIP